MTITRNLIWWIAYTAVGIYLQCIIEGVDFLLPGLLIALQENNKTQLCWLVVIYIFIQEGLGSLDFGGMALWYISILSIASYIYKIFHYRMILYLPVISLFASISHYFIIMYLCLLQNIALNTSLLIQDCIMQALILPIMWIITLLLRRKAIKYESSTLL